MRRRAAKKERQRPSWQEDAPRGKKARRAAADASQRVPEEDEDAAAVPAMRAKLFSQPAAAVEGQPESCAGAVDVALREDDPEVAVRYLFAPVPLQKVLSRWGHHPLVVHRAAAAHFAGLLSPAVLEGWLEGGLRYGLELDVAHYDVAAGRQTLNVGEERCVASEARARFAAGCSLRFLHPQRRSTPLWELCAVLERFFHSPVGCNAYWTPAGSQGFAPHYDDIDALVLQLHGAKRWRLYAPRSPEEALPRFSSGNFSASELGAPIAEFVLQQGDTLYMPRGCIHEARSAGSGDSLHVTLSCSQRETWRDLLELALPAALDAAAQLHPGLRQTLPRHTFQSLGVVHSDIDPSSQAGAARAQLLHHAAALVRLVVADLPLDAAADQMAAAFQSIRAPPPRPPLPQPPASGLRRLKPASRVRLAFAGAARLCVEGEVAAVYHAFNNVREAAMGGEAPGEETFRLELRLEEAPMVEALLRAYPGHVTVRALEEEAGGEANVAEFVGKLLDVGVAVLLA